MKLITKMVRKEPYYAAYLPTNTRRVWLCKESGFARHNRTASQSNAY